MKAEVIPSSQGDAGWIWKPPGFTVRKLLTLFLWSASLICAIWSLPSVVYVIEDAMPSYHPHGRQMGFDFVTGYQWQTGLLFWPVWLISLVVVFVVEVTEHPVLADWIFLVRVLMVIDVLLSIGFLVLGFLATVISWAGPEYGAGAKLWATAMGTMLVAVFICYRRPSVKVMQRQYAAEVAHS